MSEQEKNRDTLLDVITKLPGKKAPESSWLVIADRLDEERQFQQISAAAGQLPLLQPPVDIWQNIEDELEQPLAATPRPLWLRPWAGWAAALALALLVAWYSRPVQPNATVTIAVHTEQIDPSLLAADWDADEASFAQVTVLYQQHRRIFPESTGRDWLAELEELNAARAELKEAIQTFGRDAVLLNQLADIERERSAVLKKMAQQI